MADINNEKRILLTEGCTTGSDDGSGICVVYDFSFLKSTIKNQPWLVFIEDHTLMSIFLYIKYDYQKYGNLRDRQQKDFFWESFLENQDTFETAYLIHFMKESNDNETKFKNKLYYKAIFDNNMIENYYLSKCLNFISFHLKISSRAIAYRLLCESDSIITKVRNPDYSFHISKREHIASNIRKTLHLLFVEKRLFDGLEELELRFVVLINFNFVWRDYEDLSRALGVSIVEFNDFIYTLKAKKIIKEIVNSPNGKIKVILNERLVY